MTNPINDTPEQNNELISVAEFVEMQEENRVIHINHDGRIRIRSVGRVTSDAEKAGKPMGMSLVKRRAWYGVDADKLQAALNIVNTHMVYMGVNNLDYKEMTLVRDVLEEMKASTLDPNTLIHVPRTQRVLESLYGYAAVTSAETLEKICKELEEELQFEWENSASDYVAGRNLKNVERAVFYIMSEEEHASSGTDEYEENCESFDDFEDATVVTARKMLIGDTAPDKTLIVDQHGRIHGKIWLDDDRDNVWLEEPGKEPYIYERYDEQEHGSHEESADVSILDMMLNGEGDEEADIEPPYEAFPMYDADSADDSEFPTASEDPYDYQL